MVSGEEVLNTTSGVLEWLRIVLMKLSEFLAGLIPFEAQNIYWVILIVLSLFAAKKIIGILPKMESSYTWWFLFALIIGLSLQYL